MGVLKTSEFWSALLAAVLGVAVQFNLVTPEAVPLVQQLAMGLVAVVLGRIAHKVANGAVPFQPLPKPAAPQTVQSPLNQGAK